MPLHVLNIQENGRAYFIIYSKDPDPEFLFLFFSELALQV
jgi:hypothetical protein